MKLEDALKNEIMKKAKISEAELNKMTENLILEYNKLLDKSGALVILAKNYGIDLTPYGEQSSQKDQPDITSIKGIKENMKSVNIIGLITEILPIKSYKKKNNSEGFFFKFKVQDKTGEITVVAWDPLHSLLNLPDFKIGNILKILNGFPKKDQKEQLELYLSKNSTVELEIQGVNNELLPQEVPQEEFKQINAIKDTDKNLNIRVRVKDIFPIKNYKKPSGEESQFIKLIVSDSSSDIPLLVFDEKVNDFKGIKTNDILTVSKVNARRNKLTPELIELVPSKLSLVSVVVSSSEVQITPSNYSPIVSIEEFKKQPSKGSLKGIYAGKESKKTIQTKNGPIDLVKIKMIDDTNQIFINFWGDDIQELEKIQEGAEITVYDIYGKTNTYSKEIEGNYSRSSRISQNDD